MTVPKTKYLLTFRINCNIKRKQIIMATMNELLSKMKNITVQKKAIELYKPPKSRGNVCKYKDGYSYEPKTSEKCSTSYKRLGGRKCYKNKTKCYKVKGRLGKQRLLLK